MRKHNCCKPDRDRQQHPHELKSLPHPPPRAHHCRSPPPLLHHWVGRSSTSATSCCSPGMMSCKLQVFHLHLYSEGAGLDAVIPLDGLLLPLVVGDVPGELKHGAAHTRGGAPGRCWRTRCVFLSFSPADACYIWTCHAPRCPGSVIIPSMHQVSGSPPRPRM